MADIWELVNDVEDAAAHVLWLLNDGSDGGARKRGILQDDGAYRMTAELSDALGSLKRALDAREENAEAE